MRREMTALATGLLLIAAWSAASPAVAQEEQREEAMEECHEMLRDRGFEDIDFEGMETKEEGGRTVIDVSAQREGDDRKVRCIYDPNSGEAALDDD